MGNNAEFKYLKFFPKPFLEDLVESRCLPIIGAGFSKNAKIPSGKNMPNWNELGEAIAAEIEGYKFRNSLDAISAYCQEFSRTSLIEKLWKLLLIDEIAPSDTHFAFCDLPFDIVCTTNFEFLLEDAYRPGIYNVRPVLDEDQLAFSSRKDTVTLLKIHGDLHHPRRMILTEDDYDNFLAGNPIFATYLGSLLITRTPLFIGYSLDDTDFRQIWQVIKDRLGDLRRQAYVLLVGCSLTEKAIFERRGVKVINIEGDASNYPTILKEVFIELKKYWDKESLNLSSFTEEDAIIEASLPDDEKNRLCFFHVDISLLPFYKKYIFPIAFSFGFVPISADEAISIGDNWIAKISSLLEKSEIIVVDLKNVSISSELLYDYLKYSNRDKILFISNKSIDNLGLEIHRIDREYNLLLPLDQTFLDRISDWFRNVAILLKEDYNKAPMRLLGKKEYNAAVVSSFTLLDVTLGNLVDKISVDRSTSFEKRKIMNGIYLYQVAMQLQLIRHEEYENLVSWKRIRNKLVHSADEINASEAKKIVEGVLSIIRNAESLAFQP